MSSAYTLPSWTFPAQTYKFVRLQSNLFVKDTKFIGPMWKRIIVRIDPETTNAALPTVNALDFSFPSITNNNTVGPQHNYNIRSIYYNSSGAKTSDSGTDPVPNYHGFASGDYIAVASRLNGTGTSAGVPSQSWGEKKEALRVDGPDTGSLIGTAKWSHALIATVGYGAQFIQGSASWTVDRTESITLGPFDYVMATPDVPTAGYVTSVSFHVT